MPRPGVPSWVERKNEERRQRAATRAKPTPRLPLRAIPELPLRHQLVLPIIVRLGRLGETPPRRGVVRHRARAMHVDWELMYAMRDRVRAAGCEAMLERVVALATGEGAPSHAETVELAYLMAKLIATSRL
jgi:hypothetical protein